MSDDLYIGPTALEPGSKEPSDVGERLAKRVVIPLAIAFLAIVLVFFVFYTPIRIQGPSMIPTLLPEDRVLITHGATDLRHGDVVVLVADEGGTPTELVKRVIGLRGDQVEVRGDVAFVNGVQEPARGQVTQGIEPTRGTTTTVPEGQVFVMGDNRAVSEDSRYIGTVAESGIKGIVVAVFSPLSRIRVVHRPS